VPNYVAVGWSAEREGGKGGVRWSGAYRKKYPSNIVLLDGFIIYIW
jgi:hypothetical protein